MPAVTADTLDAAGTATVINGSCAAFNPAGQGSCEGFTFTTVDKFTTKYTEMLQTLHAALPSTTIFVYNLPDVLSIPFATTVPPVVFNPQTNQPVLDPAGHVIPLIGEHHDGSVSQIDPTSTLVTLPALSLEAVGFAVVQDGTEASNVLAGDAGSLVDDDPGDRSAQQQGRSHKPCQSIEKHQFMNAVTHQLWES